MKFMKFSSIILFSFLFMWICAPHLSAKQHRHKYSSRSSAFSFNLNLTPIPRYVEYNYVYPPATYERIAIVPSVQENVYYSSYQQPVVVQRPYYQQQQVIVQRPYAERVYTYPQYSYWRY